MVGAVRAAHMVEPMPSDAPGAFAIAAAMIGAALSGGALVFAALCWLARRVLSEHDEGDFYGQ